MFDGHSGLLLVVHLNSKCEAMMSGQENWTLVGSVVGSSAEMCPPAQLTNKEDMERGET